MVRDWERDWEMCERASPGPWEFFAAGPCLSSPSGDVVQHFWGAREEDIKFITEAREALPYWLKAYERDVRALEREVTLLRHKVQELERRLVRTRLNSTASGLRALRDFLKRAYDDAQRRHAEALEKLTEGRTDENLRYVEWAKAFFEGRIDTLRYVLDMIEAELREKGREEYDQSHL